MSTRSHIAMLNYNGSVTAIYCHNDGYLDGVGNTLWSYYDNYGDISALLELGAISSLGDDIIETIAYCRDRGESLKIKHYKNLDEFVQNAKLVDYIYYWDRVEELWYYAINSENGYSNFTTLDSEFKG